MRVRGQAALARLLLAAATALALAGPRGPAAARAAAAPAPVVRSALRDASLLDDDGEPKDDMAPNPHPVEVTRPAILRLRETARQLDRYLAVHPRDFDALLARGRILRLQYGFGTVGVETGATSRTRGFDVRDSVAAWYDRARAVRPESALPWFWTSALYGEPTFVGGEGIDLYMLPADPQRAAAAAREAVRLDPGHRFARARLVQALHALGDDGGAERAARGESAPSDSLSAQMRQLLADRAQIALPPGAELFVSAARVPEAKAESPEDQSGLITSARVTEYAVPARAREVAEYYRQKYPGVWFGGAENDTLEGLLAAFSAGFEAHLLWAPGGGLAPADSASWQNGPERDRVELSLLEIDYGRLAEMNKDVHLDKPAPIVTLLRIRNRRVLAP